MCSRVVEMRFEAEAILARATKLMRKHAEPPQMDLPLDEPAERRH